MNYYELFGLQSAPRVEQAGLQSRYFELQKNYHPDHFTDATEEEQQEALQMSSVVNEAYKTLRNPDLTLAYFLKICGMLQDEEKYNLPADFLMEMMELNEMAEEDEEKMKKEAAIQATALEAEISLICEKFGKETLFEKDLENLKELYFKKKYLKRILDRIAD